MDNESQKFGFTLYTLFSDGVKGMIQAAREVVRSTWGKPDLPGAALVFLLGNNNVSYHM